jgi:hypothetical protein
MTNAGLTEEGGWSAQHVYMDLITMVERALRADVSAALREFFPDLSTAVKAGILAPHAAKRDLSNMTMGTLRDVLWRLHELKHPAGARFPSPAELEQLEVLTDMRNRLAHGVTVSPEEVIRALSPLARFISKCGAVTFAHRTDATL